MQTYKEFTTTVLKAVERVGTMFTDPADDWSPVAFVQVHGSGHLTVIDLAPVMIRDKNAASAALAAALREMRAERCALVMSAWRAEVAGSDWDGHTPASQLPDRQEIVAVTVMDGERIDAYDARIMRDEFAPPVLTDWTHTPPESGTVMTGRFVEPIQDALR
jgi:hypothetical protein